MYNKLNCKICDYNAILHELLTQWCLSCSYIVTVVWIIYDRKITYVHNKYFCNKHQKSCYTISFYLSPVRPHSGKNGAIYKKNIYTDQLRWHFTPTIFQEKYWRSPRPIQVVSYTQSGRYIQQIGHVEKVQKEICHFPLQVGPYPGHLTDVSLPWHFRDPSHLAFDKFPIRELAEIW